MKATSRTLLGNFWKRAFVQGAGRLELTYDSWLASKFTVMSYAFRFSTSVTLTDTVKVPPRVATDTGGLIARAVELALTTGAEAKRVDVVKRSEVRINVRLVFVLKYSSQCASLFPNIRVSYDVPPRIA
jgi:hypothetical protein